MADQSNIRLSASGDQAFVDQLKENRTAMMWVGIALTIIGILAIVFPVFTTLVAELMIGWLFIFAGLVMFFGSFSQQGTGPFFGALLLSLLTFAAGAFLVFNPESGVLALTVLVAVVFMVEGAYEFIFAFEVKPEKGWGWMLVSGIISIVAGVLVAAGLPGTSLFILGLIVGINFLSTGISFLSLSFALKQSTGSTTSSGQAAASA